MKSVLGIIIAFDNDNDLRELTEHRTVAAVQWGGRYRIVDFMLSNMVNSGIYRVGILMKDKYQSLIDHIGNAKDWDLSRKNSGVTILPPVRLTSSRRTRRITLSSRTATSLRTFRSTRLSSVTRSRAPTSPWSAPRSRRIRRSPPTWS